MKPLFEQAQSTKPKAQARRSSSALSRPEFSFQFGSDWRFSRSCAGSNGWVSPFEAQDFDADLDTFARHFQRPLSSLQVDLLWLGLAVYFADRFAPRRPYWLNASPHWRRSIRVAIPVSHYGQWLAVKSQLEEILAFLTEDDWEIDARPGRQQTNCESQQWWKHAETPIGGRLALFSGGLDSLAGVLDQLGTSAHPWTLISGQTNTRMKAKQQDCVMSVRQRFPEQVAWLPVEYGMKLKLDASAMEPTQRTRTFIHVILGVVAALSSSACELHLFENGIGGFNLPVDYSQLGSQTSRGTHPAFLNRMTGLVEKVFDTPFRIMNPYLFMTKGQMCSSASVQRNSDLVNLTFSCDRFPNYTRKEYQCGVCSSCLLRRVSTHAAQINEPASSYSTDITAHARLSRGADEMAFFRTSSQALEMRILLDSSDPWNALCGAYPWLRKSLPEAAQQSGTTHDEAAARIVSLYSTYWKEWECFASLRSSSSQLALSS